MHTATPVLLILTGDDSAAAAQAALAHAREASKPLHVLQILNSDLYRYGHQDLVATRPSKREFLLHIRNEVIEQGNALARALQDKAREMGIPLEIDSMESEDSMAACLAEAKKGYDIIFLPRQEKKLFPLFKRTLAECLRKKTSSRVISC
jgi:nucleotide-binding universal stress UspA family protein